MACYCRIVVHCSRAIAEPFVLKAFETDSIIAPADAKPNDFLLLEGYGAVAFDEVDAGAFSSSVAHEPELLVELSRQCDAKLSAIAVQTGVVFVSILVADRGKVVRRYSECEGDVDIDEGELPDWDAKIREHAWNAADELVGIRSRAAGLAFGEPVGAISTARIYASRYLNAKSCRIVRDRLMCILEDGEELILRADEVKGQALNPFTGKDFFLLLHNGRSIRVAESENVSAIEQWHQNR